MRMIVSSLLMAVLTPVLLAGCLPENRVSTDCRSLFDYGMITRIEQVVIDSNHSAVVTFAGDTRGDLPGSAPSTAIVGNIAGSAKEAAVASAEGIELTVDLASGGVVVVAHQKNQKNASYRVGDRVRFMMDCYGTMWVWPDTATLSGLLEKEWTGKAVPL